MDFKEKRRPDASHYTGLLVESFKPPRIAVFRMMIFCLKMDFLGKSHWRSWSTLLFRLAVSWINFILLLWAGYGLVVIVAPVVLFPEQWVAEIASNTEATTTMFLQISDLYLHSLPIGAVFLAMASTLCKTLFDYVERAERLLISMATGKVQKITASKI